MKRVYCLALLAAMVVPSSGCSLIDRLFLANCDGPYVHQADHINGHVHDGAMYDGDAVYEGSPGDGAVYEGDGSGAMYDQGACRDGRCQGGGHCRNGLCHGVRCQEGVCPGGVCQSRCHQSCRASVRSITGVWNCASMCSTLRGACHSPASTKLP